MVKNSKYVKKYGKYAAAAVCVLLMGALLVGCMNTGSGMNTDIQNSTMPNNTMQPSDWNNGSMTPDNGNAAQNSSNAADNNGIGNMMGGNMTNNTAPIFDWLDMGTTVEDKINMISEIEKCRIVVNDGTALVGVTFAGQYQGDLTQRIRDMVAGEIMEADKNIRTVAVTSDAEDVQKINRIADQIASGTSAQEFKGEIDSIVRNVTTIQ